MKSISKPWSVSQLGENPFTPEDCLLSETENEELKGIDHSILMKGNYRGTKRSLIIHPYPRNYSGKAPSRENFPKRPVEGQIPETDLEVKAQKTFIRMKQVMARVQELDEALDDPINVWKKLKLSWERAKDDANPPMSEIVKQSKDLDVPLTVLENTLRRVLRRVRKMTQLDRVQEMDRNSMRWLVRQPGKSIAEQAGAKQRVLAVVRQENFNTPENQVLLAYCILASAVAREWMLENNKTDTTNRYKRVKKFRDKCLNLSKMLKEKQITVAPAGITPNYVLMEDKSYYAVFEAWKKLLARKKALDDLWAWQAETWTDFTVLAIIIALNDLDETELIAQSPLIWMHEPMVGRFIDQDRPLAVFWLKETNRVVEVHSRPKNPSFLQQLTRAHVSLKIYEPDNENFSKRIVIWAVHSIDKMNLESSVCDARNYLNDLQRVPSPEKIKNGLILMPAHDTAEDFSHEENKIRVDGISFGGAGVSLSFGLNSIAKFVRSDIY